MNTPRFVGTLAVLAGIFVVSAFYGLTSTASPNVLLASTVGMLTAPLLAVVLVVAAQIGRGSRSHVDLV